MILFIHQSKKALWLSLMLSLILGMLISCRTLNPEEQQEAVQIKLKGAYDFLYLTRLNPEKSVPGAYLFETCLHSSGVADDSTCVPSFRNAQGESVFVTLTEIPQHQMSQQELAQIGDFADDHQQYSSEVFAKASTMDRAITIGIGSIGGGALGGGINFKLQRHAIANPSDLEAEALELQKILAPVTKDGGDPLIGIRQLIDQEATKTVFKPELIEYLDATGLPAATRRWLQNNNLSTAHYLLDSAGFEKLLSPSQLASFTNIGGSEVMSQQITQGMEGWLTQEFGSVEAGHLFKPKHRRVLENAIVAEYNRLYTPVEVYSDITKSWQPVSQLTIDTPLRGQKFPLRTQVLNYMMGLSSSPQSGTRAQYKFGSLKVQPSLLPIYKNKLDNLRTIFVKNSDVSARWQPTTTTGYSRLDDYLKLQQLKSSISPDRLAELQKASSAYPRFHKGILGLLVKHKAVVVGTAVGAVVTGVIMKFVGEGTEPSDDGVVMEPIANNHSTNLIIDSSNSLWSFDPDNHSEVLSVTQLLIDIVRFQREYWISGSQRNESAIAARIVSICYPESSATTSQKSWCYDL